MSYAIANVIYGVPLTKEVGFLIYGKDAEPEDLGFEILYSGSADYSPGFCGVSLYLFDECSDSFPASQLVLVPTPEQRAQAEAKIAQLPEDVRKLCPPLNTYIVWSTS